MTAWLTSLVPLFKILFVFVLMLAGIRCKLGLGLSILAGSLVLTLIFGHGPLAWLAAGLEGVAQAKMLYLLAIVGLIMVLSDLMESTGQAGRFMDSLAGYLGRPRLALAFFPALIGFLPMPGGALFSAPMVGNVARRFPVSGQDKVLINYWFRHIWELAWPLYPGVILASALAGVPIAKLVLYMLPGPILAVALGWVFFLRPGRLNVEDAPGGLAVPEKTGLARAMSQGLPLLVAIAGGLALEGALSLVLPGTSYELGVVAALAAGIVICARQNRIDTQRVVGLLGSKHLRSMLFVILAIFVFKQALQSAGAVEELAELAGGGTALVAAAVLLPFLVGLVSGITLAFVGATFPLIIGLVHGLGLESRLMAYIVLGLFAGFSGTMLSPLHLCFVLTCQYFHVDLARAWRRLAVPGAVILLFGGAYFLLLR